MIFRFWIKICTSLHKGTQRFWKLNWKRNQHYFGLIELPNWSLNHWALDNLNIRAQSGDFDFRASSTAGDDYNRLLGHIKTLYGALYTNRSEDFFHLFIEGLKNFFKHISKFLSYFILLSMRKPWWYSCTWLAGH